MNSKSRRAAYNLVGRADRHVDKDRIEFEIATLLRLSIVD